MSETLKRHAPFAVLLAGLAVFFAAWTWSDQLGSLGGDSAVYVLAARQYAPYAPHDAVTASIADNSQFPPLYPLWLAATGGAVDLRLAHAATTACLLGALGVLYLWLLEAGLAPWLATAGVAAFALLPGTTQQSLYVLSESFYLLLSLAALLVLGRAMRSTQARTWWIAAALLGAAIMARTAGITLVPAFAWALWRQRPPASLAMIPAALSPAVLWALLHHPEHSYSTGLLAHFRDQAAAGRLWGELGYDTVALWWGFARNLMLAPTLLWVAAAIAIAAAIEAVRRFFTGAPDAGYALAYLALVIVWPYPAEAQRFAWLLVPFAIAYALLGAQAAAARLGASTERVRKALPAGAAVGLLLIAVPQFGYALKRHADGADSRNPAVRYLPEFYGNDPAVARSQAELHLELVETIGSLAQAAPEGECVYAIKPALVAIFGRRESNVPPPEDFNSAEFEAWLQSHGCRYFLLLAVASPSFSRPYYPLDRMNGRLEVIDSRVSQRDDSGRVVGALARLKP